MPALVARPESVDGSPFLTEICNDKTGAFLDALAQRMLKTEAEYSELESEVGPAGLSGDGVVGRSRRHSVTLVRDIWKSNSLCFTTSPTEMAGVFCVRKRFCLLDARRGNRSFHAPPYTSLLTGEGFSRVEMTENVLAWLIASGNKRHAIHHMKIHKSLVRYLCLLSVTWG